VSVLQASKQGVARIRQARKEKGWPIEDDRWLREASDILHSDMNPGKREELLAYGIFASGVSLSTWKRFLAGKKSINTRAFKAFCQVLELNWEDVVVLDKKATVKFALTFTGTFDEATKAQIDSIVAHLQKLTKDASVTLLRIEKSEEQN